MSTLTVPLVLDLKNQNSLVELPDQMDGRIKRITLANWNMEMDPRGPFFQLKFSQGIEVKSLTFSQNLDIIESAIQIPWKGKNMIFPEPRSGPLVRTFRVELFDSNSKPIGFPFNKMRCVLWFLIDLTL